MTNDDNVENTSYLMGVNRAEDHILGRLHLISR